MWIPGQPVNQEIISLIVAALNDTQVKAELSKQIRSEMDNESVQYKGKRQSYESLTSGDVNMQVRKAASGYDTYGRVAITGNNEFNKNNTYKNMKNKIRYGKTPEEGYRNRGGISIV